MKKNKRRSHKKSSVLNMLNRYSKTLTKQIIICIIILLLVIIVKKMDTAITNKGLETISYHIGKDYTGQEIMNTAKEVFSGAVALPASVFNPDSETGRYLNFASPVNEEAAVVSTFGEQSTYFEKNHNGFERGMKFDADDEIKVYAAGGGTVAETGSGGYIKITHGNGIESVYRGCTETLVTSLEKVKKGQQIGTVAAGDDNFLSFEMWVDGEIVNPVDYVQF